MKGRKEGKKVGKEEGKKKNEREICREGLRGRERRKREIEEGTKKNILVAGYQSSHKNFHIKKKLRS